MHARTCMRMHAHAHAHAHAHERARVHVRTHARTHARMSARRPPLHNYHHHLAPQHIHVHHTFMLPDSSLLSWQAFHEPRLTVHATRIKEKSLAYVAVCLRCTPHRDHYVGIYKVYMHMRMPACMHARKTRSIARPHICTYAHARTYAHAPARSRRHARMRTCAHIYTRRTAACDTNCEPEDRV